MTMFDVQAIGINAPASRVFGFIAEPSNLPKWTSAFKRADDKTAQMETPDGAVNIELSTVARREAGTIDWTMIFPDGSAGMAFSRVTPEGRSASVYSFVLMAPPVPLEALEGALDEQRRTLAKELVRLKDVLERQ